MFLVLPFAINHRQWMFTRAYLLTQGLN